MYKLISYLCLVVILLKPVAGFCVNEGKIDLFSHHHSEIEDNHSHHDDKDDKCCTDVNKQDYINANHTNPSKNNCESKIIYDEFNTVDCLHFEFATSVLSIDKYFNICYIFSPLSSFLKTVNLRL